MSEAMPISPEAEEDALKAEIAFLQGEAEPGGLWREPMSASEAATKVKDFTEAWPDPFKATYPWANPWANKKENKGKKERPPGPIKPSKYSEVAL